MAKSLLIVDDSSFSRNMIKRCLPENWDVSITEASGGLEAIEKCLEAQFDIIFLDLTMPDMDGLDVLTEFGDCNIQSKIFVVSADIQESSKAIAVERGAIDFLAKPVRAEPLLSMLNRHEVLT